MYDQHHDDREAYVAFQEGTRLLAGDNAHAAVIALERARELEPAQGSVREALARAYFRTGRFASAEEEFRAAVEIDPVNDYAHYGLGVCKLRTGDATRARGHLRLAAVMRPENVDYRRALAEASEASESPVPEDSGGGPPAS
jgi:Flp pilus assembly protein TadD